MELEVSVGVTAHSELNSALLSIVIQMARPPSLYPCSDPSAVLLGSIA